MRRYALDFSLEDGMKVEITGRIGVYEKGGTYQIYAKKIGREGQGELYERFLALKEELEDMGMFADIYKQPIPHISKGWEWSRLPREPRRQGYHQYHRSAGIPMWRSYCIRPRCRERERRERGKGIEVLDSAEVDVIIAGRGGGSIRGSVGL